MLRKIITIDETKCNGCGLCANACHEGAIGIIGGKAKLLRDDYCDGLGNCLPVCPAGAISFEEREAAAYDEEAVLRAQQEKIQTQPCGCPGTESKEFDTGCACPGYNDIPSQLKQWPVQIKLVPANAPYFKEADLLIAADCTAYAYANMHTEFMQGHITLIGCPKLDGMDYSEKLGTIFTENDIHSITVARMEVPCCGGLEYAVKQAIKASGKDIPCNVVIISIDGNIKDRREI